MHKLFTYGTLQDKKIQLSLFERLLNGTFDELVGFEKETIVLGTNIYPILVKSKNSKNKILGTCYEVNDTELLICDKYEGDSYQRIKVKLNSNSIAWVYITA